MWVVFEIASYIIVGAIAWLACGIVGDILLIISKRYVDCKPIRPIYMSELLPLSVLLGPITFVLLIFSFMIVVIGGIVAVSAWIGTTIKKYIPLDKMRIF